MPQDVLDNLAVVFTNTEKRRKLNFKESKLTEIGLKNPPSVCFENPFCEVQRMVKTQSEITSDDVEDVKELIDSTAVQIKDLLCKIGDFKPVATLRFIELNAKRERVEALLTNIIEKHSEEQKRIADLEKYKSDIMSSGDVKPITRENVSFQMKEGMFN